MINTNTTTNHLGGPPARGRDVLSGGGEGAATSGDSIAIGRNGTRICPDDRLRIRVERGTLVHMPIYVYETEDGTCVECGGRFEMFEGINEPPLTACPACECPVHRIMAAAQALIRSGPSDPIARAQAAGFKALKRDNDGSLVDIKTGKKFQVPKEMD
jgi:putative FmdB family regulatory protein